MAALRNLIDRLLRSEPRQYVWFLGTGATAAAVFLITFFAVSAATDDDGVAPASNVSAVELPGAEEEEEAPSTISLPPEEEAEPEPVVTEEPEEASEPEPDPVFEEPPVEEEPPEPRVPLPEFDEADLIHGGAGSQGAILAGRGIVPSSGADRQTDWELLIPSARIKASIVKVGLAPGNAFGAPDNPEVIGWWESGPAPGQDGNVLLDGHRDFSDLDDNLGTGVCWSLPNTQVGDAVLIRDTAAGLYYVYEVTEATSVRWNDPDAISYLEPSEDARLTLITCEGSFDDEQHNYSNRRIVVAMLMGVADVEA